MNTNIIHTGDCFDVLTELPDESVHAVVSDPPYGLAFMGRDWDDFEPKEYQEWCEKWARECLRVLKPGGHMLAFSGNRTHHRLFTGVEDAGFEIRDTLTWHYGSGFPKASDISKTIDKRADAEREVVGIDEDFLARNPKSDHKNDYGEGSGDPSWKDGKKAAKVTAPATDAAKKWDGWKTGLKPSTEFVVMARKPYDGATVDSVLEHGTGALNIDACRVKTDENWPDEGKHANREEAPDGSSFGSEDTSALNVGVRSGSHEKGRYPSNLIFDELAAEQLDADVGETKSPDPYTRAESTDTEKYGDGLGFAPEGKLSENYGDSGGPSRYFYTSKATKAERTLDGKIDNAHPTVKPRDLMQWLVKLVTAENQIVLDPFCGSGTTLRAAKDLNRQFIGIERQSKWADVARVRAGLTPDDPSIVRDDAGQSGLEAYEVSL